MKKKLLLLLISILTMFPLVVNADIKFPKYVNGNTELEGLNNGEEVYYQWVKYKDPEVEKQEKLKNENITLALDIEKLGNNYGKNNENIETYKKIISNNNNIIDVKQTELTAIQNEIDNYSSTHITKCDDNLELDYKFLDPRSDVYDRVKGFAYSYELANESQMNQLNCSSLPQEEQESCINNYNSLQKTATCYKNMVKDIDNYGGLYEQNYSLSDDIFDIEKANETYENEKAILVEENEKLQQQINEKRQKIQANRETIKELENNPDDSKWIKVVNNEIDRSTFNDDSILYIKIVKNDGSSELISNTYNYNSTTGQYKNVNNMEDNANKKKVKLDKIILTLNSNFNLSTLLEDTSIVYSSNNAGVVTVSSSGLISGLKIGTAVIIAEGDGKIYTIDIEVKGSKIEDSTGNSSIIYNGDALDEGTQENYNKINENDNLYKEIEKKVTGAKRFEVIEITLTKDGQNVQPKSKVTVEIKIPSGLYPDNILVYYVEEDGTLTLVNHTVVGDKVQIDTDKVGKFVIVEKEYQNKNESSNNTTENPKTGTIISISVIIVGIIVATGIYFYTKKKNKLVRL